MVNVPLGSARPIRQPNLIGGGSGMPFTSVVLKMHSRCNLNCGYCYLYNMADTSWRDSSVVITPPVIQQAALRLAEHASVHHLDRLSVALHGGEPLLAGEERIKLAIDSIRTALAGKTRVRFSLQTNATLLDEPMLEFLSSNNVSVGVSLDGGQEANDRYRLTQRGTSSYRAVHEALLLLSRPPWRRIFAGILAVIDLQNDPLETYDALAQYNPPLIDFLLPHGNWSNPPPNRLAGAPETPYADWLWEIITSGRTVVPVRFIDTLVRLLLRVARGADFLGLSPGPVVIGVDGTIEQVDTLMSAYDGAAATGLNVFDHPLDAATLHPQVMVRSMGVAGLCETCQECPARLVCGGGYYPHRYKEGEGFNNPSVYCPDLLELIRRIESAVKSGKTTTEGE